MQNKVLKQFKTFLLSHQRGEDPNGYISKLARISELNPDDWNGKLPPSTGFKPDLSYCKVSASTKTKPIVPWWWYLEQKEPVPPVMDKIYSNLVFDWVMFFHHRKVWVYFLIEPEKKILELLDKQDKLRAFIVMSIINKNFTPNERKSRGLSLGRSLTSKHHNNILTYIVYSEDYELAGKVPKSVPSVRHLVDSNGSNWQIFSPGQKQCYWSFKELLDDLF